MITEFGGVALQEDVVGRGGIAIPRLPRTIA